MSEKRPKIIRTIEPWVEFHIEGGGVIMAKLVVAGFERTEQLGPDGQPVFTPLGHPSITFVYVPPEEGSQTKQ